MTQGQRSAFLIVAAIAVALALSGAVAFRPVAAAAPRRRTGSGSGGTGEGGTWGTWSGSSGSVAGEQIGEGVAGVPRLDSQYLEVATGKKVSLVEVKKQTGSPTFGAGSGTALGLDG
jgi:hypothetical protein